MLARRFHISSKGMLYNNISHLPITCILVVYCKYSNMHNTFPESRNISWTTRYIGNDNSNTYLCLFGRIHLHLCILVLLESLPMCLNSSSDSKDMFLSCSWSEILRKYSYTIDHIECVMSMHLFLSNDEMDKSIIWIFISIIILDHIPH